MADQWTDSFSEDWVSQPRSSPAGTVGAAGTLRSNFSSGTTRVLHERNYLSVNSTTAQWHCSSMDGSECLGRDGGTHVVARNGGAGVKDIPEWKRKVLEDFGAPGGKDLFSPIQLESMFRPPAVGSSSSTVVVEKQEPKQQTPKKPANRSLIPIPTNTAFHVGSSAVREEKSRHRPSCAKESSSPRRSSIGLPRPKKVSMLKQGMHKRTLSSTPTAGPEDNSATGGKRKAERYADIENDTRSNIILPGGKSPHVDRVKSKAMTKGHSKSSSDDMKEDEGISPIFMERLKALKDAPGMDPSPVKHAGPPLAVQESRLLPLELIDEKEEELEAEDTVGEMTDMGVVGGRRPLLSEEFESSIYPSSPPVLSRHFAEVSQFEESEVHVGEDCTYDDESVERSGLDLGSPFISPSKASPPQQHPQQQEKKLASPFVSTIGPPGSASQGNAPDNSSTNPPSRTMDVISEDVNTILDNIRRHKDAPKSPLKGSLIPSLGGHTTGLNSTINREDPFITNHSFSHPTLPAPRTPPTKSGEVGAVRDGKSSGSPLKLFHVNYDTYTNERLVKRLGELEDSVLEKPRYALQRIAAEEDEREESWHEEESLEFSGGSIVVNRLEAMARKQEKEKSPSRGSGKQIAYAKAMVESHKETRTTTTTATATTNTQGHHRRVSAPDSSLRRGGSLAQDSTVEGIRKHRRWKSDESAVANDGISAPRSPVKERTPKRVRRSNSGVYTHTNGRKVSGRLLGAGSTPGRPRRISPKLEEGSILLSSSRARNKSIRTPATPVSKAARRLTADGEIPTPSSNDRLRKVPVLKKDYDYNKSGDATSSSVNGSSRDRKNGKIVFSGSKGDAMEGEGFGMLRPGESETLRKGSVTTQDFLLQAEEVMERIRGIGLRSQHSSPDGPGTGVNEGGSSGGEENASRQTRRGSNTSQVEGHGTRSSDPRNDSKDPPDAHIEHDTLKSQSSNGTVQSRASVEVITPDAGVMNHHLALKNSSEMTFDQKSMAWVKSQSPEKEVSEPDPFVGISDLSVDSQEEARALEMARKHWEGMTSDGEKSGVWRSSRLILDGDDEYEDDLGAEGTTWESRPWFAGEDVSTVGSGSDKSRSAKTGTETRVTSFGSQESKAKKDIPTAHEDPCPPGKKGDQAEDQLPEAGEQATDDCSKSTEPARRRQISYAEDYSSPTTASMMRQANSSPKDVPESWADGDESCLESGVDGFLDHGSLRQSRRNSRIFSSGGTYRGAARRRSGGNKSFVGRPISRITEEDEDNAVQDIQHSLRRVSLSSVLTPLPTPYAAHVSTLPPSTIKNADVSFHMTPLGDLSYQFETTEALINLELSFLATRRGPKASAKAIEASFSIAQENLIKNLTDVEPYEPYWSWMKYLKLNDRRMETLHTLNEWCQRIEELDVCGNELGQLTGVPEGVRDLKVAGNCLSGLTHFGHLVNLQYLDVSRNGLENLDGLRNLKHLREIKADDNFLENLDGVFKMDGLGVLRARRNKLTAVAFEKTSMKRLTELDLRGNKMKSISGIENLPALIHLNLDQNRLDNLNIPTRARLDSIRSIKLTQNNFETFDLSPYPNIRILYMDNNLLRNIDGLNRAKHLESISTREQNVREFTVSFERMYETRKIYLSGNPLRNLSFKLDFLNLQYLELASAQLTNLPQDFGYLVSNTRVLNLNNNAISDLRPLLGIARLKKLLLVGNRIKSAKKVSSLLGYFPSLSYLDLRMNPLTVGFYPASASCRSLPSLEDPDEYPKDPFTMMPGDATTDQTFQMQMDIDSAVTRRRYEMMIGQKCLRMKELDGLEFRRGDLWRQDDVWDELKSRGLVRTVPEGG